MKLNNLKSKSKNKTSRRLGRGLGSGRGKSCGRGTKGQKARAGYKMPRHFEGGQTPLIRRLPKIKGFRSRKEKKVIVNLAQLEKKFSNGQKVTPKTLFERGLIKNPRQRVKILARGKLTKKLLFFRVDMSQSAQKSHQDNQ